jgi:hypothetical protein
MGLLDRFKPHRGVPSPASSTTDPEKKPQLLEIGAKQIFRPRIIAMAIIVSMGGFIFGTAAVVHAKNTILTCRYRLRHWSDFGLSRDAGLPGQVR